MQITTIFLPRLWKTAAAKSPMPVSKNNALLNRLREKGHNRLVYGGSKILEELEYGEGDMSWYSGYDSIEYTPKQLFTAAEYSLKLCAVPVAVSGEDLLKNSGKYQIMDLFEKRIENAQKTMCNKMSEAVYGDGTGGKRQGDRRFGPAGGRRAGNRNRRRYQPRHFRQRVLAQPVDDRSDGLYHGNPASGDG